MSTSMPRVFVTQEITRINYADAMDYGDVVFLTSDEYKPEPTDGRMNATIKHDIGKKMVDYIPGVDYILTSGSPVSIMVTGMIIGSQHARVNNGPRGVHRVLKWNNQSSRYDLCLI